MARIYPWRCTLRDAQTLCKATVHVRENLITNELTYHVPKEHTCVAQPGIELRDSFSVTVKQLGKQQTDTAAMAILEPLLVEFN